MALYRYEAFSKEGKKMRGTIDASSVANVKDQLTHQQLFPITIELAPADSGQKWWQRLLMQRVSEKEKILFTKQLAILLKSGVPLLQAIELLTDQFENQLRSILVVVKDDLKDGSSLADALSKYPRIFDNIYVQLVKAGEASGQLELILERLTGYLERRAALRQAVRSAMQEPLIQLVLIGIIVTGLLIFVVPQMAENFMEQGQELPGPTKFLLGVSNLITGHYLILILTVVLLVVSWKYWSSTPRAQAFLDRLKLKLPIVKYLSKMNAVVQFSYTLGLLLEGGVNLAQALDIVVAIIDNRVLANTLRAARDNIVKQGKIAHYLKETNIFPPIAIYLLETGEQSGQLDTMLLNVAATYEQEVVALTTSLTKILKPAMFIVMAVVVGFIVLALALPIFKMGELAQV